MRSQRSGRGRSLDDGLVAGVAFAVYVRTLAPGVTTGDSGELIAAAATSGLAHPTGYPLYLLIGRAWIELTALFTGLFTGLFAGPCAGPFAGPFTAVLPGPLALSPALAMNLLSALLAAAAVVCVRRLAELLLGDRAGAAATAALFAFSASLWSEATTARVYTLSALLLSATLLEWLRLRRDRGGRLGRAWLGFGLAMANHTVALLLLPLLAAATARAPLSWRGRARAVAPCGVGLALYLYVPIAAARRPEPLWGDPTTVGGFLAYMTRQGYWERRYVDEWGDVARAAAHYLASIPVELGWIGAAALALGIARGTRLRRDVLLLGLYLFAGSAALLTWHGSHNDVFHWGRYLIPGWLGLTLLAGLGVAGLAARLRPGPSPPGPSAARVAAPLRAAARTALLAAAPLGALLGNFAANDRSGDTFARDFSARILERLPPGALLLAGEDNVYFPLLYLHRVEGLGAGIEIRSSGDALALGDVDPLRRPVFAAHRAQPTDPGWVLAPAGLVFRIVARGAAARPPEWAPWALASFESVQPGTPLRFLDQILVAHYWLVRAANLAPREPEAARRSALRARELAPDDVPVQINAGLFLEGELLLDDALAAFERAQRLDPEQPVPRGRVEFLTPLLDRLRSARSPAERTSVLAGALLAAQRPELALRAVRDALADAPDSAALHHQLGQLLAQLGRGAEARAAFERVLALRPGHPTAQRSLEALRRAGTDGSGGPAPRAQEAERGE